MQDNDNQLDQQAGGLKIRTRHAEQLERILAAKYAKEDAKNAAHSQSEPAFSPQQVYTNDSIDSAATYVVDDTRHIQPNVVDLSEIEKLRAELAETRVQQQKELAEFKAQQAKAAEDYQKFLAREAAIAEQYGQIDIDGMTRAIQMGTEEEGKAALQKVLQQTVSLKADLPNIIANQVNQSAAILKFQQDFPDIANDPSLTKLAADLDNEQRLRGDTRPYSERYTEIGNTLRSKISGWAGALTPRQARKAATPSAPVASNSSRFEPAGSQEKEESREEIFEKMRQKRAGPMWVQAVSKH